VDGKEKNNNYIMMEESNAPYVVLISFMKFKDRVKKCTDRKYLGYLKQKTRCY
jgi:hypothetical protein